jgi:cytochrome c-type biogenesis protein CcmF
VFAPISGGLLIIMVICPLAVWSYVSFKHLGRQLWKPFLVSLVGLILPVMAGLKIWPAVIAFWLVAFVLAVNVFEFAKRFRLRREKDNANVFDRLRAVFQRNQRSFGAMIIHVAVVLIALGIIGIEFFQTETQGTIPQDGVLQLADYEMVYEGLDIYETLDARIVARAEVQVKKDGEIIDRIYPRRDFYYETGESVTIPGVRSTLADDFYVVLIDWREVSQEGATFKIYHNPLVKWLWIGTWMFIAGVLVATWPEDRARGAA